MQIFQRLFKVASVQGTHQNTTTKDEEHKLKDIAKACFYRSIYLIKSKLIQKRVKSSRKPDNNNNNNNKSIIEIKKEGQNSDSSKVLPLSVSPSPSTSSNEKKHYKLKGDHKTKPMFRMKMLLRWTVSASTKSEKGEKLSQKVNKALSDEDRLSSNIDSPKISFSTSFSYSYSSSSFSEISMASSLRNDEACNVLNSTLIHGFNCCSSIRENWITTDSEFVVLELSG